MIESARKILLKPKDIAQQAGVLTSKINFYAIMGLLRPADYSEGGQKLYDRDETLLQLARIKRLVEQGMSLERIKERVAYVRNLRRIFIIDDDQEVVDFIMDVLKGQFNFSMHYARDGFAAGRMLNLHFPDLIILDLNLPGINGFDLCRSIAAEPMQRGVKVLAITGYDSPENRQRILAAGAHFCLAKPFDAEEFKKVVCRLLRIRRPRQSANGSGPVQ